MQVEIKVPALPESVTEGTLGDWHKQVGDSVAVEENIVDLETDKVVLEIVASSAGVIKSIAFASGDTVKGGDVLGVIDTEAAAATAGAKPAAAEAPAEVPPADEASGPGKASPAVRKLLLENDLKAEDVQPTGKKGAITRADVERHLKQRPAEAPVAQAPAAPIPTAKAPARQPVPSEGRNDRRVPMSRLRAKIAERLKQAQNTAAMLTTFNEVNLKPMMDTRAQYREA
ncbi:MAG: E3 binding domain-containing protein, partial [Gammaproteobacteria bacterium]|nr:E3 binding domain-containing protein [Gammaproteobacteria bacterium]